MEHSMRTRTLPLTLYDNMLNEAAHFLEDLKENNNRAWFEENKKRYQEVLEQPAKALALELKNSLETLSKRSLKSKIFRIYRDVRFSKDKTPYNTHLHIGFSSSEQRDETDTPMFFFGLEPDRVLIGLGNFTYSKEGIARYRHAIIDEKRGKTLEDAVKFALEKPGFSLSTPELKRVPGEFDKEHPRADYLKRKSLSIWYEVLLEECPDIPEVIDYLSQRYMSMLPIYQWMEEV